MAHAVDEDDRDDEGDGSVDEDPLDADQDSASVDDDEETIPCPFCKKPIHEDADVCPRCRNFVGGDDGPRRVPPLVWIGVILAGLCALTWIFLYRR